MKRLIYPVLVSKSKEALESEEGMAPESYESAAEGDLLFRSQRKGKQFGRI